MTRAHVLAGLVAITSWTSLLAVGTHSPVVVIAGAELGFLWLGLLRGQFGPRDEAVRRVESRSSLPAGRRRLQSGQGEQVPTAGGACLLVDLDPWDQNIVSPVHRGRGER